MASRGVLIPLCITLALACTQDEAPSAEDVDARIEADSSRSEDSSVVDAEDSSAIDANAGLTSDANTEALDGSDGAAGWLPSQCEGVTAPLLHDVCMEALSEACAMHKTERECSSQETLNINDFAFRCGWARVVSFADASACEGAQSTSRCVAAFFDRLGGCANPCRDPTNPDMRSPFTHTAANELIERPCGTFGGYFPRGMGVTGRCDSGPVHPLCACAAAACAAQ